MMEQHNNKLSTCYGFTAVIIWAGAICLSRSLMEKVGMFTAAGAVFTIGGMISIIFYLAVRHMDSNRSPVKISPRNLFACGIPFVLYILCLYTAVGLAKNRQQVIEVGLLNYLWPAFALIFSVPLLGKRTSFWLLPGTVVALSGILLANIILSGLHISISEIWRNFSNNALPYVLALAASVLWGLYSNLARRFSKGSNVFSVPFYLLTTGILLEIIRFFSQEHSASWTATAFVELTVIVLFPTITAYVMWDSAMRRGNLLLVASFAYFTPLLSTIMSGLYLGVPLTSGIWVACALVIAGAWISKNAIQDKKVLKSKSE